LLIFNKWFQPVGYSIVFRQLLREFPWYDPGYRRIPSEYLISGYHVPEDIEPITDKLNFEVRRKMGELKHVSGAIEGNLEQRS